MEPCKRSAGEYVVRIHRRIHSSILAASSGNGIFRSNDLEKHGNCYSRYPFEGDFFHDWNFIRKIPKHFIFRYFLQRCF